MDCPVLVKARIIDRLRKERQHRELGNMGIEQKAETPVVTNELSAVYDPNNFSRWQRDVSGL